MKIRDVIPVIILLGIGYVGYKFWKGDWKLGDIFGGGIGAVLPGDIGQGWTEGWLE